MSGGYSSVSSSGPLRVMATVCSNCTESLPSAVMTVQPSGSRIQSCDALVDHRLDGENHAGDQARAGFGLANVGDGQVFVQGAADAVAAPFVDDADALGVGVVLDGPADVVEAVVELGHVDAAPQRLAANPQ